MKKNRLQSWNRWEHDEDSSAQKAPGLAQAAAIRISVVTSSDRFGNARVEVLELDGLRWGFDSSVVPGPDELQ